jgi:phosphopantothenoylcysteine decarboxylase/phosphopantothenate--cysteine ligase
VEPIVTVEELGRALEKHFFRHDVLVMAAAVGDFIPTRRALKKIPRQGKWKVSFRQAPDLVRKMARRKRGRVVIGFSLETGDWLRRSRKKRLRKNLDGIVANYYSPRHNPFGRARPHVAFIDERDTRIFRAPSKGVLARQVVNWAVALGVAKN